MKRFIVLGGVLAALGAAPATAQEIGVDAAFNSRYEWRGVSLTNNWVMQPDAWVTFGRRRGAHHRRRVGERRARRLR